MGGGSAAFPPEAQRAGGDALDLEQLRARLAAGVVFSSAGDGAAGGRGAQCPDDPVGTDHRRVYVAPALIYFLLSSAAYLDQYDESPVERKDEQKSGCSSEILCSPW